MASTPNSQPATGNGAAGTGQSGFCPWRVVSVGIDTIGWIWRPDDPLAVRQALATGCFVPAARGWRARTSGRDVLVVGVFPPTGFYAEGRLAAVCDGDRGTHRLAAPAELVTGTERAAAAFEPFGIGLDPEAARVRRIDLSGELGFADPRQGLAFLRALAAADLPGLKTDVWRRAGCVESVLYRTPRRRVVVARGYDKGREAGIAPPGTVIRLERQMRFPRGRQRSPREVAREPLGELFLAAFRALAKCADLVVTTATGAMDEVLKRVEQGLLTPRVAERLLGTLVLWQQFGASWGGWSEKVARDRCRQLRELGIVVALDGCERLTVPIGHAVMALEEAWA
jgi:hypothetical protein